MEVVYILLNRGADVNIDNTWRRPPLTIAALHGHVGVVEILLSQKGTYLDSQDENGRTALWMAASEGHEEVLRLLLAAGADPSTADDDDWHDTPLYIARLRGHYGCIRLLQVSVGSLLSYPSSILPSILPSFSPRICI